MSGWAETGAAVGFEVGPGMEVGVEIARVTVAETEVDSVPGTEIVWWLGEAPGPGVEIA